jgi:hypothetical protein
MQAYLADLSLDVDFKLKERSDLKKDLLEMKKFILNTEKEEQYVNWENKMKLVTMEIKYLKKEIKHLSKNNEE